MQKSVKICASVKDYISLFSLGITSSLISKLTGIIEKYLSGKVFIEVPGNLAGINVEAFQAIDTSQKLQELGIIEKINKATRGADEPFAYYYYTQTTGENVGGGISFLSEEDAIWSSIGEAVERHLWFYSKEHFQKKIKKVPFKKIKKKAIDIFSLAGFSQKQKRVNEHLLSFDENTLFGWIKSKSLVSAKKIHCPAQLFGIQYTLENVRLPRHPARSEPLLRWPVTTGTAVGRTKQEACVKGILESLERDAFMVYYMNKISPPSLDLNHLAAQDDDLAEIFSNFRRYLLDIQLLYLKTDFPVHIVCALTIDSTTLGPKIATGASADFDLKRCILGALSETLLVRSFVKPRCQNPLKKKKSDFGRNDRSIYWAKEENFSKIEFLLKGRKIKTSLKKNPSGQENNKEIARYYRRKLDFLTKEFRKRDCEILSCDFTPREIRNLGLHCFQVVCPELQPLHLEESIPYLGGKRYEEVPIFLGQKPAKQLNNEPHPFS